MFQLSDRELRELGANITVKETLGQPNLWRKVLKKYIEQKEDVESFLSPLVEKYGKMRVLFTGAGSSQYVGDTVVKSLKELGDNKHFRFESAGTTDIVSAPQSILEPQAPTLLVSFARSGNSPESVAAVKIVNDLVSESYHLIITCAREGELAKQAQQMDNAFAWVLPEESNDQGFAMTGSCSSMTLLSTLIFSKESMDEKQKQVEQAAQCAETVLKREEEIIASLPEEISRIAYVGSGPLADFVREAQLKVLELTAGKVCTIFDSSMGFRHGPKSFVNEDTIVFVFAANQEYTRQYDIDLYQEVKSDNTASRIILVGQNISEGFDYGGATSLKEAYLVFPAFAYAQVIALHASLLVKNTPDTPSATGTVNRVVKGVTIHSLK